MEAAVLRGKCKKKLPVFTLLLLCVLPPALSAPATSSEGAMIGHNHSSHGNLDECPILDYISDNGVCCRKCHPGERLVKDCPERNMRTSCKPCREGTFMDKSNTSPNCIRCRVCKAFEEQVSPCQKYKDRECRCVKGYYRNFINSETHECLECKICRSGCEDLCALASPPITPETPKPPENVDIQLSVAVVCCIALLVVISLVTYLATKESVKRRMRLRNGGSASSSESNSWNSQKSTRSLIPDPECPERQNLAVPTQECESDLPDCVPKEIKIQQVIYSVLDLVSVRHVKQLVRSLGVSERDIERAEVDYRSIQETNYQMLKLWAEGGGRGGAEGGARGGTGRGVLPRALLQDLLEKLREMDLGGVAEELEEKFRVQ